VPLSRSRPFLALLACWLLTPHARADTPPLAVFVAIPPQAYLVQRIAGPHANVGVLLRQGQDPHTFEPSPSQLAMLGRARAFFPIGMPFERRLVERIRATYPALHIVDVTAGIRRRTMREETAAGHDPHAPAGEPDPHVWMAPPLLATQAVAMADALVSLDPSHADLFRRNLKELTAEIAALDRRVRTALAPFKGRTFYVFHPAFGYFADAYGLRQMAVETEGKIPTPRQLSVLIKQARADGVNVIIVQPQYDRRSAESVAAAIGGSVFPVDPLAPDILQALDAMCSLLQRALGAPPTRQP